MEFKSFFKTVEGNERIDNPHAGRCGDYERI